MLQLQVLDVLQYVAVCCSMLQYVALCCSALWCAAVCCSVLQCTSAPPLYVTVPDTQTYISLICVLQCGALCCSVLRCVAVCCGVLQCVAVRCSACSALQSVAATHEQSIYETN